MRLTEMFPSKWLHADDLPKTGQIVTISDVGSEEIGFDRDLKNILTFEELDKRLILNVTKGKRLYEILPGPNGEESDSDNWVGQRIKLVPARIQVGSEMKETILIEPADKLKRKPGAAKPSKEEIDFGN